MESDPSLNRTAMNPALSVATIAKFRGEWAACLAAELHCCDAFPLS